MSALWASHVIGDATGGLCTGRWDVNGLSIDSRSIKPGDFFIALKGPSFDGHDYVADALKKGASGALVDQPIENAQQDRLIKVTDTFQALEKLGVAGRARSKAKIVAVTGSVGKTGCKEALRQIFAAQKPAYANEGSFNNHWGVPLSLARMPVESAYGVFEIGMNHAGELGPLSRMVKPDIAIITNIAPVHIGNFEGLDGIASAKAEIFDGLSADGHAVIDGDSAFSIFLGERAAEKGIKNIHRFGKNANADARLKNAVLHDNGSDATATIMGRDITYYIGAPGEHWVKNSLAVLLAAHLAGADLQKAAETLHTLRLAHGRGVTRDIPFDGGSFTLIDESYNASPVAVDMAIKVLGKKQPRGKGRRLLALADMRELGSHARDLHLALVQPIIDAKIDRVFCCGEMMKHLYEALPENRRGAYAFTADMLAPLVATSMQDGDIITIKGSHSMMMEKTVAALTALEIPQTPDKKAQGA